jgi:hypothetical protein
MTLWHLGADFSVFRCKKCFRWDHLTLKKQFFTANLGVGPNLGMGCIHYCVKRREFYVIERPMVTSATKGGTQKFPKKLRLSKPTDMTIHWKALGEHFLMVHVPYH